MDLERSLISRIITDSDFSPAADARVTRDWFRDATSQRVYDTIVRHMADYGEVPSAQVITMDHTGYKLIQDPPAFTFLLDRLRAARKLAIIEMGLTSAVQAHDKDDPDAALKALAETVSEVLRETPASRDINLPDETERFWDYYLSLKALDGRLRGIPTGYISLDNATQGWQPGNLIIFTGVQKSGKSTLMLNSAIACHRAGKIPAFFGFEMSNAEQQERHIAFWSGVSHERLRSGQLKTMEERQLQRGLRTLAGMPDFYMSTDSMGTATISALASKLEQQRPDVAFIDGVYMMDDERGEPHMSPQALSNIVQGLKQIAMNTGIPIVCTTQSLESKLGKGGRVTSGSVGYSSAFGQYCDAMVSVEQTEEQTIQRIALLLGRNARTFEAFLEWDWERGRFFELEGNPFRAEGRADEYATAAGF